MAVPREHTPHANSRCSGWGPHAGELPTGTHFRWLVVPRDMEQSGQYPGMPRWVKITAIVTIVVIVVAVAASLILGGEHGPNRHLNP